MTHSVHAFCLFVVLMAAAPSWVFIIVAGGLEPVWVYYANTLLEVDRGFWIAVSLAWTLVYFLLAWCVTGAILRHRSVHRHLVLIGMLGLVLLSSLLPIYSPLSHGSGDNLNIFGEINALRLRFEAYSRLHDGHG